MAWYEYFKKARRDRQGIFLEFTDEELKKYNQRRWELYIYIVLGFLSSWTGIGLVIFLLLSIYVIHQMNIIYQEVTRRYLKKQEKDNKSEGTRKKR